MVRRIVTWILVADGARARIFINIGVGKGLSEHPERSFFGSRRQTREIGTDRPGRTFDSVGAGRHAISPPSDPHERVEAAFACGVVTWLDGQERAGAFARLIVLADPRTLGVVRRALTPKLAARLSAELAGDFTRADVHAVEARVATVLAV